MSSNFKTIEEALQAVLDKKPLQYLSYTGITDFNRKIETKEYLELLNQFHWSSFRVKPELKTLTYQTCTYRTKSDKVLIWSSLNNSAKELFEELSYFSAWLEPTQEHTLKYEVTD